MTSVVIPSRNSANLEKCVTAKLAMESGPMHVIVVDDGLAHIPPACRGATILDGKRPFVFARNCNIGIHEALADSYCDGVILLNDDAVLKTPGGFTLLADAAALNPDYGVISAVTNCAGNPLQYPKLIGLRESQTRVVFVCVYIPRTTFETVGYLDERFTAYGFDDDDMCRRVKLAGLRLGIHDGCFVDHMCLPSTFRGKAGGNADIRAGRKIYEEKWGTQ